jgi:predicted transcriptional regulator
MGTRTTDDPKKLPILVAIRFDLRLKRKLDQLARREDRPFSYIVRRLLREKLGAQ